MKETPALRVTTLVDAPVRADGDYVLYWMIAARRTRFNWSLQHAVSWARQLKKPLLVLEALRFGYPWASDRFHAFVLDGMADNLRAFAKGPVSYYPFVETPGRGGKGLLRALAARACVVITDDYPCFFLPKMVRRGASLLDTRFEQVDGNGLMPLRASEKVYLRAVDFRRHLQRSLPEHLLPFPDANALSGARLPRLEPEKLREVEARWPPAAREMLERDVALLLALPIDHQVQPVSQRGGSTAGRALLDAFVKRKLARYLEERNQPEQIVTSGLSPYLHFGNVGAHEVMDALLSAEGWSVDRMGGRAAGQREGFWGLSPAAEAFVDQLITWRELGFNFCHLRDDYQAYGSLPAWARATLEAHAGDAREHVYTLEQFERGETHDALWNAAQNQLRREGAIHNYLRMLWGKKILEWTPHPEAALEVMVSLNDKYALDGRDPNSYSGIFWVLGRYDRAWGPEREIFGKIRYMSSANTARKVKVKGYIARYGGRVGR